MNIEKNNSLPSVEKLKCPMDSFLPPLRDEEASQYSNIQKSCCSHINIHSAVTCSRLYALTRCLMRSFWLGTAHWIRSFFFRLVLFFLSCLVYVTKQSSHQHQPLNLPQFFSYIGKFITKLTPILRLLKFYHRAAKNYPDSIEKWPARWLMLALTNWISVPLPREKY